MVNNMVNKEFEEWRKTVNEKIDSLDDEEKRQYNFKIQQMSLNNIKFKQLNWVCRIGIIGGWITFIVYALTLILEFLLWIIG